MNLADRFRRNSVQCRQNLGKNIPSSPLIGNVRLACRLLKRRKKIGSGGGIELPTFGYEDNFSS